MANNGIVELNIGQEKFFVSYHTTADTVVLEVDARTKAFFEYAMERKSVITVMPK